MSRRRDAELARRLRGVRAPAEAGAERRAWTVARSVYAERPRAPRRRRRARFALAPGLAVIAGVLALTPAGAAVHGWIDQTLGVRHASRQLIALPAPGRILVSGAGGTWTIAGDGSRRRLGGWRQATWSPRGLYVAAAGPEQLAALTPRGVPQWAISRPQISFPRWYSPTGFRVAYLSGRTLRVIAGDGSGDRPLAAGVARVAPAWRPGHDYELAYADGRGSVVVREAGSGQVLWRRTLAPAPRLLRWSTDGSRLLALTSRGALVLGGSGRTLAALAPDGRGTPADAALSPDGRVLALLGGRGLTLTTLAPGRRSTRVLFSGIGLHQLAFSPDGRWLLVSWPAADQWIFIRVAGTPRIEAVSRIAEQFGAGPRGHGFPELEGWCCSVSGGAG